MSPDWVGLFFPGLIIFWILISLAVVWEMAWKGVALWRAGRNAHLAWFIVLLIFNTLGILPIIYIFAFSRKASGREAEK
jgi:hypothetical protein